MHVCERDDEGCCVVRYTWMGEKTGDGNEKEHLPSDVTIAQLDHGTRRHSTSDLAQLIVLTFERYIRRENHDESAHTRQQRGELQEGVSGKRPL